MKVRKKGERENEKTREEAIGYIKQAIGNVNDAFKWVFQAKDYENAELVFQALENLKIAYADMDSKGIWKMAETKAETISLLNDAADQIAEAVSLLLTS